MQMDWVGYAIQINLPAFLRMAESRFSWNQTTCGLRRPLQEKSLHLGNKDSGINSPFSFGDGDLINVKNCFFRWVEKINLYTVIPFPP